MTPLLHDFRAWFWKGLQKSYYIDILRSFNLKWVDFLPSYAHALDPLQR